jgi:hypothetical protein
MNGSTQIPFAGGCVFPIGPSVPELRLRTGARELCAQYFGAQFHTQLI